MSTKQTSDQSIQTDEILPNKRSRLGNYLGYKDITLKDILTILFTLLVPAMIGILAVVLQKNQIDLSEKNRISDLYINQLQRQSDDDQTATTGNDTVFNNYIKNILDMAVFYQENRLENPRYELTRALTMTALRQLDSEKKRLLIQFLYDIKFARVGTSSPFGYVDNQGQKHLQGIVLNNVDFSNGLKLRFILLQRVTLTDTSFANSDLEGSYFADSVLTGVNFTQTNLVSARFINTQLQQTNFNGASLAYAQFIRSNLTQSNINDEQLSQALTIYNTILPNGTYARNKSYVINGDGKQGMNGWNITSGDIRVKDSYFFGNKNSAMFQRMNVTNVYVFGFSQTFQYCLSFLVHGQDNLIVEITSINEWQRSYTEKISPIQTNSCENNSSNSLPFCYWSLCKYSQTTTFYMDLKFIFGYDNNSSDFVAVKDIQLTIISI